MSNLMMSVSGIRGIFGRDINAENVMKFAAIFGFFQKERHAQKSSPVEKKKRGTVSKTPRIKILVGRDSRTTGDILAHAVMAGLFSVGVDVVWLGIVATPTLLLSVKETNAQGGICITASHNPAQWNAMKFVDANGMFLFPDVIEELFILLLAPICSIPFDKRYFQTKWDEIGTKYDDFNATSRHLQKIFSLPYIDKDKIRKKKYKVVLDSVNGAGGTISPNLLRELGCELIEINSEPSGCFAHDPEPLAKNLSQICHEVKKHNADIGFATDPDVDRLVIIDNNGECIGEEYSLLLATKFVLRHKKGDIVTNLSTSMAIEDIANEFGVRVFRTPIGEINVSKAMIEQNSPIGGEGNGGIICPDVNYARDAITGMALILSYMSETEKSISDLVGTIPKYFFAKDKIEICAEEMDLFMKRVIEKFKHLKMDTTDGIKIFYNKAWVHIRKSGTEPIIRVYAEAENEEMAQLLCQEVLSL